MNKTKGGNKFRLRKICTVRKVDIWLMITQYNYIEQAPEYTFDILSKILLWKYINNLFGSGGF